MFIRATKKILGLANDKAWDDVRKDLNEEQIKKIHEIFEGLWPRDTDLSSLLPRPDERKLRAVYLGLIDPRTVSLAVTGLLPYFDEIIIGNPFVNPGTVKPEFSPTKSASKYKVQTLKNVVLLLSLEPFIDAGFVHMVPDPADFSDIRHVMLNLAEQRVGDKVDFDDKDRKRNHALAHDDMVRADYGLPDDVWGRRIQSRSPELSPEQVSQVIALIREKQKQDPLALLQQLPAGEEGTQLQVVKGLNLEVGLFLAQFTGAIVYTDVDLHWRHLHEHATKVGALKEASNWQQVIDSMRKLPFRVESDLAASYQLRMSGRLNRIPSVLKRLQASARKRGDGLVSNNSVKELARELDEAKKILRKEWQRIDVSDEANSYQGNLEVSFPVGGFERNTIRRLLLTYGRAKDIRPIPMALFFQFGQDTENGKQTSNHDR